MPASIYSLTTPRTFITQQALDQFSATAKLSGCVAAAAMPDLHPGRGIPVGAAFATCACVYPHLVGADAGCGARMISTQLRDLSMDRCERKLRDAFGASAASRPQTSAHPHLGQPWCRNTNEDLLLAVWQLGPRAMLTLDDVPPLLRDLCNAEPETDGLPPSPPLPQYALGAAAALGTIGGGNHFAELGVVEQVTDSERASHWNLQKGAATLLIHTGSRSLGAALHAAWGPRQLTGSDITQYLGELAGACRFARTNRIFVAFKMLRALGVTHAAQVASTFDITHNDIRGERLADADVWVHRKGAAPAPDGAPTVVLGSRGAASWIMCGNGNASALSSVAHGAGRRLGRHDALQRLKARYKRADLTRTALGSRVICDDDALLYEEHPDAYKAIAPIIDAIETHGAASRVASILPTITIKV